MAGRRRSPWIAVVVLVIATAAGCVIITDPFRVNPESVSTPAAGTTPRAGTAREVVRCVAEGAQQWTAEQRTAFANDPLNLIVTTRELNQQKGAGDAATWLPPNRAYRCGYVARQAGVKQRYGVWVTQAEQDAMLRVLAACPAEPLPIGVAPFGDRG